MEDVGIKVPVQAELLTDGETWVQHFKVWKEVGVPNFICYSSAGEMIAHQCILFSMRLRDPHPSSWIPTQEVGIHYSFCVLSCRSRGSDLRNNDDNQYPTTLLSLPLNAAHHYSQVTEMQAWRNVCQVARILSHDNYASSLCECKWKYWAPN